MESYNKFRKLRKVLNGLVRTHVAQVDDPAIALPDCVYWKNVQRTGKWIVPSELPPVAFAPYFTAEEWKVLVDAGSVVRAVLLGTGVGRDHGMLWVGCVVFVCGEGYRGCLGDGRRLHLGQFCTVVVFVSAGFSTNDGVVDVAAVVGGVECVSVIHTNHLVFWIVYGRDVLL